MIAVRCAGPGKQLEVAGCCPQQRSAWRSDWEVIIAPRDPVRSRQRKTRFCSRRCSCPVVGGTPSPSCTLLWRIDPCGWSHLTCGRSHPPPLPSVWRWYKPPLPQGAISTTQTQGSCGVRVVPLQPLALSLSSALFNPLDHGPKPSLDSTSGKLTRGPDWGHSGAGLRPLEQRRDSGAQQWMVGSHNSRGNMAALICQQRVTQWAASAECWRGPKQPEPRAVTYGSWCSRA